MNPALDNAIRETVRHIYFSTPRPVKWTLALAILFFGSLLLHATMFGPTERIDE